MIFYRWSCGDKAEMLITNNNGAKQTACVVTHQLLLLRDGKCFCSRSYNNDYALSISLILFTILFTQKNTKHNNGSNNSSLLLAVCYCCWSVVNLFTLNTTTAQQHQICPGCIIRTLATKNR